MILTDDERRKFAEYLEQDAASSRMLLRQLVGLDFNERLAANLKREIAAALIVAQKLRSVSSESIG